MSGISLRSLAGMPIPAPLGEGYSPLLMKGPLPIASNGRRPEPAPAGRRSPVRAVLGVPLAAKIAGANVLMLVAGAATCIFGASHGGRDVALAAVGAAAVVSVLVNITLVRLALSPLRDLERTASRVGEGDLAARVPASPLADRDVARVGQTINRLLDGLIDERTRVRRLAGEVIRAGDAERARVAHELHDGAAQTLAALGFQASAAARIAESVQPSLADSLGEIRDLTTDALEQVRLLSLTVHPRVLDDLGLRAALENLVRGASEGELPGTVVDLEVEGDARKVAPAAASALYRVAQEALANAVRHAGATRVGIHLAVDGASARLEIHDDGRGFDLDDAGRRRPGMGLFVMQERVALLDGRLHIETAPGAGTRVVAVLPLTSNVGSVS